MAMTPRTPPPHSTLAEILANAEVLADWFKDSFEPDVTPEEAEARAVAMRAPGVFTRPPRGEEGVGR